MTASSRKLLALLYLAGFLMLGDQLADLSATVLASTPHLGAASWRFGIFGVVAGRMSVLLVADVFLFAAAIGLDHRRMLRLLGWLHLGLAVAGLAALVLFVLDAVEVQHRAAGPMTQPVILAAGRAGVIALLAIPLMGWVGLAAIGATRTKTKGRGAARDMEGTPLLTDIRRDERPS